jgi:hypothetical protein
MKNLTKVEVQTNSFDKAGSSIKTYNNITTFSKTKINLILEHDADDSGTIYKTSIPLIMIKDLNISFSKIKLK